MTAIRWCIPRLIRGAPSYRHAEKDTSIQLGGCRKSVFFCVHLLLLTCPQTAFLHRPESLRYFISCRVLELKAGDRSGADGKAPRSQPCPSRGSRCKSGRRLDIKTAAARQTNALEFGTGWAFMPLF